jgi:PEP-CTERM motif
MHRVVASLLVCAVFIVAPRATSGVPITVPTSLSPGNQYRLVFVTSTRRTATSSDIAQYNSFVTAAANSVPELVALETTWKAIASTAPVDARDNTGTNPNVSVGVPIFNLADELLASDNADLWDGTLNASVSYNETGARAPPAEGVWTGTLSTGEGWGATNNELGGSTGAVGLAHETSAAWIVVLGGASTSHNLLPLYAMSGILVVVPEPSSIALASFGFMGLVAFGWRRVRSKEPCESAAVCHATARRIVKERSRLILSVAAPRRRTTDSAIPDAHRTPRGWLA